MILTEVPTNCPCCNSSFQEEKTDYSNGTAKRILCSKEDHKITYTIFNNNIETIRLNNSYVRISFNLNIDTIWISKIDNPWIFCQCKIEQDFKNYKKIFSKIENIITFQ